MSRTHVASPHAEAAGMGLAMAVVVAFAVLFFPVTLLAILAVRSCEYVPRAIHWVGRKAGASWAQ